METSAGRRFPLETGAAPRLLQLLLEAKVRLKRLNIEDIEGI
jgi:hypothetical protein